jgi:hypothetical protein
VQAVSRLSNEIVWQQMLANPRTHGTLKGLARDALSNSVTVYSDIMVRRAALRPAVAPCCTVLHRVAPRTRGRHGRATSFVRS